jgi:riboflavin kinase/FMN adenylyltransferase
LNIKHLTVENLSSEPAVLALGNFDGVHRGHMELMNEGKRVASSLGLPLAVLLFDPHPLRILAPERELRLLLTPRTKICLLESCGVDEVYVLNFDRAMADCEPAEFVELLLRLGVGHLVVGFNYTYGRKGAGTPESLTRAGEEHGFGVSIVPAARLDGRVISSTAIRECLLQGDVETARAMSGRHPLLTGRVVAGVGRGRELGFPTANLELPEDIMTPGDGVYAVWGGPSGQQLQGMLNIGLRPTFGGAHQRTIEAHFFDLISDLYGQILTLGLVGRLRAEQKFAGPEELRQQLALDEKKARELLAAAKNDCKLC